MAVVKQQSPLAKKYGASLASGVQKGKEAPVDYGNRKLPPGIANGVAQLTECGFEQFKTGSNMKVAGGGSAVGHYYFSAVGVVVSPTSVLIPDVGQVKVAGLQTRILIPLCPTEKNTKEGKVTVTTEEHVQEIINMMKMLGGPEFADEATEENMESLAAQLQEEAPHFSFSTSGGKVTKEYPNPKTFENWHGAIEYAAPEANGQTLDHTGGGEESAAPSAAPASDLDSKTLTELAEMAEDTNNPDCEEAQLKLRTLATEANISDEDWDSATSWQGIADMLETAMSETAAPTKWKPTKGMLCKVSLLDPETGKPAINPRTKKPMPAVVAEVTSVNALKETANLRNNNDKKTLYKDVLWSDLVPVE